MAALGLAMAGLGPLLMFAAGLLWGLDFEGDAAFFLGTAAAGFIGAFLVLKVDALWGKIVAAILAFLVGGALFWTAFGLFAPMSFFDFVPGLLVMPGTILGIVGSIAAAVAISRNRAPEAPADGERKTTRIVLAALTILALGSAIMTFVGKETVDEDATHVVTFSDFEFDSESYTFAAGDTVLVRNDDPFLHTFVIDEYDIDEVLSPGSEVLVTIPDDASGDHKVYCEPHTSDPKDPQEDDMAADLTIE